MSNVDEAVWEIVEEDIIWKWRDKLDNDYGVRDAEILYSGFWSQGDGASFTGRIDLEVFIESQLDSEDWTYQYGDPYPILSELLPTGNGCIIKSAVEAGMLCAKISRHNYRYCHSNTVIPTVEYYPEGDGEFLTLWDGTAEELVDKVNGFEVFLESYLSNWIKKQCDLIYRELEEAWTELEEADDE